MQKEYDKRIIKLLCLFSKVFSCPHGQWEYDSNNITVGVNKKSILFVLEPTDCPWSGEGILIEKNYDFEPSMWDNVLIIQTLVVFTL